MYMYMYMYIYNLTIYLYIHTYIYEYGLPGRSQVVRRDRAFPCPCVYICEYRGI